MCNTAIANIDLLLECGFTKPVNNLQMKDKADLIQMIALHKVILASLAELSDFKQELCVLGVADAFGSLLRPFFCNDADVNLTSG